MSSNPERIVISDDDGDDEPIINSQPLPVAPPRPVKKVKKEVEEEEEKQDARSIASFIRFVFIMVLLGAFMVGLGYGFSVWWRTFPSARTANDESVLFHGPSRNTLSVYALYNTTTPDIVWRVRKSLQQTQYAYYDRFPCLCMHHMLFNSSFTQVRLCNIYNPEAGQHYFLVNPRVIGALRADLQVPKLEQSVGCKEPRDRHVKRHTAVFLEWEDESSRTHYALFRDQIAYCMQLAINEFEGFEGPHCI